MKRLRIALILALVALTAWVLLRSVYRGRLDIRVLEIDEARRELVLEMNHHGLTAVYIQEVASDYPALVGVHGRQALAGLRKFHFGESGRGRIRFADLRPDEGLWIQYTHQKGISPLRIFLSRLGIVLPSTGRIVVVEGYEPWSAEELERRNS